eukprot:TRINITY_DN25362_c0_g1_i1.p1 TRINITY_DN25362_c0_g1~~TRINITY_DN25362_c0_g1_i1.p1  ORF type:complete len:169 (-),score=23.99 TRINITY_DN25362_c0_g1_i1:45-527(-)
MGSESVIAVMMGNTSAVNRYRNKHCTMSELSLKVCCTCAIILTLLSALSSGSPRHKSSKLKFQDNDISPGSSSDTCKMSEPCGWALYVPGSSPRKIYKYTRNIFCSCSGGTVCSLTRDALQQNSFVFYCRPKETSKFRFPTVARIEPGCQNINFHMRIER